MCRPIGFSFGRYRWTNSSVTTATGREVSPSRSSKVRPTQDPGSESLEIAWRNTIQHRVHFLSRFGRMALNRDAECPAAIIERTVVGETCARNAGQRVQPRVHLPIERPEPIEVVAGMAGINIDDEKTIAIEAELLIM